MDLKVQKYNITPTSQNNPKKLKEIIGKLELENREKEAQIIELGMHLNDILRVAQRLLDSHPNGKKILCDMKFC